jgi:hypothetical protein
MERSTFNANLQFLIIFFSIYAIWDIKDQYLFYHTFFSVITLPMFTLAMNIIKERSITEG